ncbi:MAG TPA: hypothetical protein VJU61_17495, partial [Polyangiaceae bacterium]|nr:hypothetical protein [Polyangiaceae bacterium]
MDRARAWYLGGIVGSMTLAALSCLPTEELSNYGQPARNAGSDDVLEEPGAIGEESVPSVEPGSPEGGSSVEGSANNGTDSSENGAGAGCTGECPLTNPPLEPSVANDQASATLQPPDAGSDAGAPASEPVPPVTADAGPPLPSCPAATLLGPGERCFQLSTVARAWADATAELPGSDAAGPGGALLPAQ